ncbi:MAG: hypothetical protein MOGMAGMI_02314 [Candidatus Omnitrophica bacterium]|nr:hypothetical protein [Candidatus Omnitrophota bacterium]
MIAILVLYLLGVVIVAMGLYFFSGIGSAASGGGPGIPSVVIVVFAVLWPILTVLMLAVGLYSIVTSRFNQKEEDHAGTGR